MPPDCCCHSFVLVVWPTHGTRALLWFKHARVRKQDFDKRSTSSRFIEELFLVCPSTSPSVCSSSFIRQFPLCRVGESFYTVAMRQPSPLLTDWLLARAGAGYTSSTEGELSARAPGFHIHEQGRVTPPLSHYGDNHTLKIALTRPLAMMRWKIGLKIIYDLQSYW